MQYLFYSITNLGGKVKSNAMVFVLQIPICLTAFSRNDTERVLSLPLGEVAEHSEDGEGKQ